LSEIQQQATVFERAAREEGEVRAALQSQTQTLREENQKAGVSHAKEIATLKSEIAALTAQIGATQQELASTKQEATDLKTNQAALIALQAQDIALKEENHRTEIQRFKGEQGINVAKIAHLEGQLQRLILQASAALGLPLCPSQMNTQDSTLIEQGIQAGVKGLTTFNELREKMRN
jgi:hypothetical protein